MTSTTYITLNLQAPNTAVTVNAKQNDRLSRYISAALYDGSVAFVPPVGASAAIRYKKPDGTGGFYDVDEDSNPAIVITGSTALLTLAEQCTTVPGDVYMELNFYTGAGDKLTSFTWRLKVEQSVLTDTIIASSNYYNVLTAAIATTLEYRDAAAASATAAAASATAAAASATSAEHWAGVAQNSTAQIYDTNDNGVVDKAERLATVVRLGSANFDGSNSLTAEEMGLRPDTWMPTPKEVGAEPAFSKNTAFNKNFGSAAGTVCQGNDSRLSDARRASNIGMSYDGNLYISYS